MERKFPKRSYKGPILISALAGFCLAYIIIYIAAFMGQGGRYHGSIATMLFFLIILVVVCTGVILARINRTRDEILDRLEALEQREPEQSPPPQPVPPEAPDSPASPSEK